MISLTYTSHQHIKMLKFEQIDLIPQIASTHEKLNLTIQIYLIPQIIFKHKKTN